MDDSFKGYEDLVDKLEAEGHDLRAHDMSSTRIAETRRLAAELIEARNVSADGFIWNGRRVLAVCAAAAAVVTAVILLVPDPLGEQGAHGSLSLAEAHAVERDIELSITRIMYELDDLNRKTLDLESVEGQRSIRTVARRLEQNSSGIERELKGIGASSVGYPSDDGSGLCNTTTVPVFMVAGLLWESAVWGYGGGEKLMKKELL